MDRKAEEALIEDFLGGNESAFNRIASEYRERIYWHARRMTGNHLDADEVSQEVLIALYKNLKNFKFNSSLFTWIYKITANKSINHIRKKQLKKYLYFEDDDTAMDLKGSTDIVQEFEDREKLERLQKILQSVPPKQRQVFIFRQFDGLSYEEISKITGKTTGGLKANYFQALKKITGMIENE